MKPIFLRAHFEKIMPALCAQILYRVALLSQRTFKIVTKDTLHNCLDRGDFTPKK